MRTVLHLAATMAVGLLYSLWSARPLWADAALLLVLAGAVRLTWRGWAVAAPPALRWPALAVGVAHVLSTAFSTEPLTSWRAVLGLAAYALVFMLAGNALALGVTRGQLYRALVLTAQVLVAAMLAGWLVDGARLWGYRVRFEANNTAALMALLLMPALVVGECRRLVLAQAVAVAWLTSSRSGALGMLAGLFAAAPLSALTAGAARRYWRVGLALGLVLALALASRAGRDLLTPNGRDEMWAVAGRMFADSPLWGQGPNTFKAHWLAAGPWEYAFGHAHNLYLNLAAETGMLGLAAGAWLMWAVLRSLSRAGDAWPRAATAATVALLAHSLGDTPTTAPYIVVAWLALLRIGLHEPA